MRHSPIVQHSAEARPSRSRSARHEHDRRGRDASAALSGAELARCRTEIAKLLPLWPHEAADMSPAGRAHILATLERALRAERRRGIAGHWTYNLARHVQLLRVYRSEKAATAHAHQARRTMARAATMTE